MFFLIIITLIIGLLVYYVWNLPFETGDGFTEAKKNTREVEYSITDRERVLRLKDK